MHDAALVEQVEPLADRRSGARHVAVMLIAKLSFGQSHTIGRIRNMSAMGARVETHVVLNPGEAIEIELRSDLKMAGQIMWFSDGNAGVQFDAPIDVSRFLIRPENRVDRIKVRAPRYHCIADAVVRADSASFSCKITDIGMSGAGLVDLPVKTAFKPGQILKLETDGISAHNASVVWAADHRAGVKFRHPLKYTELQQWICEATRLICSPEEHRAQLLGPSIAQPENRGSGLPLC